MLNSAMVGLLGVSLWETIYMVIISTLLAYAFGLPIGVILNITAKDFFDDGNEYPEQLRAVFQDMQKLSPEQIQNIHAIVKGLLR